jgi:hypothetical protein
MPKPKTKDQLAASRNDLVDRLYETLPQVDDEAAVDSFLDAEALIDTYLDSVAAQSTDLPDRRALALACTHLLVATNTITERDLAPLSQLNATELGVSLYALAPTLAEMKQRALAGLEAMAKSPEPPVVQRLDDNDIPF